MKKFTSLALALILFLGSALPIAAQYYENGIYPDDMVSQPDNMYTGDDISSPDNMYAGDEISAPDGNYENTSSLNDTNNQYQQISPELGILVVFDPSGGTTPIGHESRITVTGDGNSGTIGAGNMPDLPTHGSLRFIDWTMVQSSIGLFDRFNYDTVVFSPGQRVYAIWGHELTFAGGGGTLNTTAPSTSPAYHGTRLVPTGHSISAAPGIPFPNQPMHPGHTFAGWFINNDPSRPFLADTIVGSDLTIHARWEEIPRHTVTFDMQGGQLSSAQQGGNPHALTRVAIHDRSVSTSSSVQYSLNLGVAWPRSAPEVLPFAGGNTGNMTLEGWWTQPNGWEGPGSRWAPPGVTNVPATITTAMAQPGGAAETIVTEPITVYAHWVHRVTFHPNGGFVDPGAAQSIFNNGFPNPSALDANRNHYRDLINPGTIDNDGLLYNRISNTAVPAGMPESSIMQRPGHDFAGWWNIPINPANFPTINTAPANAVQYFGNTPVDASTTWYARWIPRQDMRVTFNVNNGQWPTGNASRSVDVPVTGTVANTNGINMPPIPERDGFIFVGWYPYQDGSGTRFTRNTVVNDDIDLYAQWLTYVNVVIDFNGGTNNVAGFPHSRPLPLGFSFDYMSSIISSSLCVGAAAAAMPYNLINARNQATRPGYFIPPATVAWNTAPDGLGQLFNASTPITAGMMAGNSITIYVRWGVTVVFNDNRSTGMNIPIENDLILGVNTATDIPIPGHRTQVLLGNSFINNHLHPNAPDFLSANSPHFPEMHNFRSPQGGILQYLYNPITPFHFVFGWNTARDGSGDWYHADTVITTGPRTLYGQWSTTLTFHPGIAPWHVIPFEYRESNYMFISGQPITPNHFTSNNYINPPVWGNFQFAGWSDRIAGGVGSAVIDVGSILARPTIAYAQWHANLLFDANGGIITPNLGPPGPTWASTINVHDTLSQGTISNAPTRSNWDFVEWNTHINGLRDNTGIVYGIGTPMTRSRNAGRQDNERLFAQWATNVRFDTNNSSSDIYTSLNVPEGGTAAMPPNPTHPNPDLVFSHWQVMINTQSYPAANYVEHTFSGNTAISDAMEFININGTPYINVIAVWIYPNSEYQLTISNYPENVPMPIAGQTPGGVHTAGDTIALNHGTSPSGWEFLGWARIPYGSTFAPPDIPQAGAVTGLLPPGYYFNMPESNVAFVAIWRVAPQVSPPSSPLPGTTTPPFIPPYTPDITTPPVTSPSPQPPAATPLHPRPNVVTPPYTSPAPADTTTIPPTPPPLTLETPTPAETPLPQTSEDDDTVIIHGRENPQTGNPNGMFFTVFMVIYGLSLLAILAFIIMKIKQMKAPN